MNIGIRSIGIIGCGTIGAGIARRLAQAGHNLYLHGRNLEKTSALAQEIDATLCKNVSDAVSRAEIIVLAVKPQDLGSVADTISQGLRADQLVVSTLAGVTMATLRKNFNHPLILRMMPNLALLLGEGVIGLAENTDLKPQHKESLESIFSSLGTLHWLPENQIDALTAVTGSSPAFFFVIVEAMVDAAITLGFPPAQALQLVIQTMKGAATILEETKKHPAELRWQVTSPAGTTIAGLNEMEKNGVRSAIISTLLATHQRAKEMGRSTERNAEC